MFGRKNIVVPEWASVLKQKEYSLFISAVDDYFKRKGKPYTIDDGIVRFEGWDLGLVNLVQMCAGIKPQEYAGFIEHHFGVTIEIMSFKESLAFDDFERMKQYIGVRLYDREYTTVLGEEAVIRRPFAGEVFAVLVYDFPQAIQIVPKSDAEKWGKTEEKLYAIGIENIRQNYELTIQEVNIGEDTLFVVEAEHFFAPNILFELEKNKKLIGKGGAIIGIPTRSLVMIYPIRDMKVIGALNVFFNNVTKFYKNGPGSLTKEIYWYRDGQYETLNYEVGEKVKFTPSEAFLALLDGGLE